jgi:hypothetical protein
MGFLHKALASAALIVASTGFAAAAPANVGQLPGGVRTDLVIPVHGFHRSCQRGPGGWHRHNRYGERRLCRRWDGRGRRPNACVQVGPIYYCDY